MNIFKLWREYRRDCERRRNLLSHGPVTKRYCDLCGTHIADLERKQCIINQRHLRHLH
jgi:hypothetical protein